MIALVLTISSSKDSREEALRFYNLAFKTTDNPQGTICLNPHIDKLTTRFPIHHEQLKRFITTHYTSPKHPGPGDNLTTPFDELSDSGPWATKELGILLKPRIGYNPFGGGGGEAIEVVFKGDGDGWVGFGSGSPFLYLPGAPDTPREGRWDAKR